MIESQLGREASRQVWDMTLEAIRLIGERRERFGIECDWRPGYLGLAVNERKARDLQSWQAQMQSDYGYETTWITPADMPRWIASPRFHSGIHDPLGGHLHPLKYSLGMARAAASLGVQIHEDSPVTALDPGPTARLRTPQGSVRRLARAAGQATSTCRGWHRSWKAASCPSAPTSSRRRPSSPNSARSLIPSGSAVCDTNFVLDYFRPTVDNRMLYGGRGELQHRHADEPGGGHAAAHGAHLSPAARHPGIEFAWGGFVDISMNRAPDFGRLSDVNRDRSAARGSRQRLLPAGLLRPRTGSDRSGRQAGGRSDCG